MNRIVALVLAFILLALSCKDLIVYSIYTLDRDYIVDNFCINKERPELMCSGKCFLEEQLTLDKNQKESSKSIQSVVKSGSHEYFQLLSSFRIAKPLAYCAGCFTDVAQMKHSSFAGNVFHPPIA